MPNILLNVPKCRYKCNAKQPLKNVFGNTVGRVFLKILIY